MKIIAVNHQPVCLFVQVRDSRQQGVLEGVGKVFGIDDKIFIAAQKIKSRRTRPTFRLVYGVKRNPLVALSFVGDNLRPKRLVDFIQRDTPIGCHDKFLFEPKLFLKVFNLREELDNNFADAPDSFDLSKISFDTRLVVGIQILQAHYLALYKEIQLASQETAQVLMDKVIESIFRRVAFEVLFKQSVFVITRQKQRIQFFATQRNQPSFNGGVILFGVFLLLIFGNIINKTNHKLRRVGIVFKGFHAGIFFRVLRKKHERALAVIALLVIISLRRRINQTEMNAYPVKDKSIVLEILTGLDIVLILIRPVQFNFLALVGNGINIFPVTTLGNKIAVLIVTVEERIQRGVNVRFQRDKVGTFRQLFLKLQILLLFLRGIGKSGDGYAHCDSVLLYL